MVTAITDNPIEQKVLSFIEHAENHPKYQNQRERAELNADFEAGQQWTQEQYDRYKEVGVEPIVINRCLATVKALDGLYVENQQDIIAVPRKGGAETAARVLSEVLKHSQDMGGLPAIAPNTFRKGNIQTASYIGIEIDKTKSANGQICFQSYGFFDCLPDPDCADYDMDKPDIGAKYIIVRKWIDKDELAILYGDLSEYKTSTRNGMESYIAAINERAEFYTEIEKTYRLPVYTIWWKEKAKGLLVGDTETGETRIITENVEKFRRLANKSKRFTTEIVAKTVLHKSTVINGAMVSDEPNPLGEEVDFFPIVRYVPIFREDYERGILDDAVSINFEENLRRTQVNRLLIITANTGWKASNTNNAEALEELKRYGSVPGFVADESKFGGKLEKIKPTQIPNDFLLAKQSSQDMNEVTGLNAINRGYDESKDEPGVVLNMRRQQGITANSGLFDNFKITLELLGNKLLAILGAMDIYTEDEIRGIVEESHLIDRAMMEKAREVIASKVARLQPPQPLPQPPADILSQLPPDQMQQVFETMQTGIEGAKMYADRFPALNRQYDNAAKELAIRMLLEDLYNSDVTMFGIKVTTSSSTPTARLAHFQMIRAIQDQYGIVPPDILLKYSDLPDKDEVIARIQQAQQGQMMQPQPQGRMKVDAKELQGVA